MIFKQYFCQFKPPIKRRPIKDRLSIIRELLKEDEEIKKIVHQQSYEALAKATREALKFSL